MILPPLKLWFNWRFEGLEHIPREGPVLVACNHISYLDQFSYGYFLERAGRRPRFLAKAELFENRALARVLHGTGQIPVKRGTGDPAPLDSAKEALAAGHVVVVFPEGTVTKDPDYMPQAAKTGIARLTLATGVPVTPLASWGAQHVWQRQGRGSLAFGRPVWMQARAPLDLSGLAGGSEDADALREVSQRIMDELTAIVTDLRSRYPERWR